MAKQTKKYTETQLSVAEVTKRRVGRPTKKQQNYGNDVPVYLFHEGTNYRSYELLGAHFTEKDGKNGVIFRVWAPNCREVSVVGDFNGWDTNANQMTRINGAGIWECFIEGLKEYDIYKYALKTPNSGAGYSYKSDPFAFHTETPPENASKLYNLEGYEWQGTDFEQRRKEKDVYNSPINIFEVNLLSWRRNPDGSQLSYRQLAEELVPYVKEMGYTHVEFMPITEYPFEPSWGYQVTGYFAPTSRMGTPKDFMYLIDQFHVNDIAVIVDWVPAHFPKDGYGLYEFDGTYLYEDKNPLRREHKDWGTRIFDFGKTEVQSFLVSSAMFMFDKYHIDGLRVDAVAAMLYLDYGRQDGEWARNNFGGNINLEAVAFLQKFNMAVRNAYPYALTVAEESTAYPKVTWSLDVGGLGFTHKWNMGWMNDVLSYMKTDPMYRYYHHNELTFSMMYAYSENYILPISHDEVVYGKGSLINKMPGSYVDKFGGVRAFMGYMMSHPGKKLMFMGQEIGQFAEWDYRKGLDYFLVEEYDAHKKMQLFFKDLNNFYKQHDALYSIDTNWNGFEWLVPDDSQNNVVAYERKGYSGEVLLCVINFSGISHYDYRIGVNGNRYKLAFLSDDERYGGYNKFGDWVFTAESIHAHGRNKSIRVNLAPLSFMYLIKEN